MAPNVYRKTHEDLFWGSSRQKEVFCELCERNFVGKSRTETFRES